ncbi:MAG: NAD-dependent epimerase/dehydratase family protein [Gemmatimonadaceae bacterium]
MRIVVTGGDGFIGRNLRVRLGELGHREVASFDKENGDVELHAALADAEFVFHLAGVNRPKNDAEFAEGNATLTASVCAALRATGRTIPLVYTSSTQAELDNAYGRSKRAGELEVERYGAESGSPAVVLRLTNVFGKWSRPNYNSAVATFCHNVARGLPITVNDPNAPLRLVYIDDVVDAMIRLLDAPDAPTGVVDVGPVHATTVGEVAALLAEFVASRETLMMPRVGTGLTRALHATYVSFLPPEKFAYGLRRHADPRGVFVEMLRTPDCGQFSFFTAGPGITRGEHYHHSKTEKFLVIKGTARFGFRHIVTGERYELTVGGDDARVVETVPGWTHNITNIGDDEVVVMLWANEIFDPARPDTIASKVET